MREIMELFCAGDVKLTRCYKQLDFILADWVIFWNILFRERWDPT